MLRVGDRFENPRTGATLEILRVPGGGDSALEVRRLLRPGTGRNRPHVHLDYVERFVVEQGVATALRGGSTVTLGPGDELEIPAAGRHVNAHNAGQEDLVLRHSFEPAPDVALAYAETLGHLMSDGRAGGRGEVPLVDTFAIAHATRSQTYVAGVPHALQRSVLFPIGALLARLGGRELHLPS
ncbi:MAG: cupin domain-containing protein [Actinomycetota bacterium]|nr:cupin domain-containing protein [Actinomycetota bacterium]